MHTRKVIILKYSSQADLNLNIITLENYDQDPDPGSVGLNYNHTSCYYLSSSFQDRPCNYLVPRISYMEAINALAVHSHTTNSE